MVTRNITVESLTTICYYLKIHNENQEKRIQKTWGTKMKSSIFETIESEKDCTKSCVFCTSHFS